MQLFQQHGLFPSKEAANQTYVEQPISLFSKKIQMIQTEFSSFID